MKKRLKIKKLPSSHVIKQLARIKTYHFDQTVFPLSGLFY
ncbi:hypothetical protein STRCR_1368 [Streptococcus criceti HS-6]|uniref:Uncharacterized protein n=1 Tax=Streptococcus criceti HS-6 TaxID=873449 RepID=G5JN33_STRCG|nr:hypothetical protein STRCR_1368 [Streptococcus criceti HS-6]